MKDIIALYETYIKLLGDELNDTVGIAAAHGWKSTKYEQGVKCRKEIAQLTEMPEIICLCGSTRFVDTFNEWRKRLTYEGKIVLSIEIVTTQTQKNDPQSVNPKMKKMLDELHKRKIDLADEVLILNVGDYIGESTKGELEYAKQHRKTIKFLEPHSCQWGDAAGG